MSLFSVHVYFKIRWFGGFFSTLTLVRDFEMFFSWAFLTTFQSSH